MNRITWLLLAALLFIAPASAQMAGGQMFPGPGTPATSGGGTWTPSTDTGMVLWWRADSVNTTGSNINSMTDKSGNGWTGSTVIGGGGGTVTLNSSCINSQPCAVTTTQGRIFSGTNVVALATQTTFSIGLIYIQPSYSNYPRAWSFLASGDGGSDSGTHSTHLISCTTGGGCSITGMDAQGGGIGGGSDNLCSLTAGNSAKILLTSDGATMNFYCNGTLAATGAAGSGLSDGHISISMAGDVNDSDLNGSYADFFFTKTLVSSTDFNTYVNGRYAF
jgi:hypothetical protein